MFCTDESELSEPKHSCKIAPLEKVSTPLHTGKKKSLPTCLLY